MYRNKPKALLVQNHSIPEQRKALKARLMVKGSEVDNELKEYHHLNPGLLPGLKQPGKPGF